MTNCTYMYFLFPYKIASFSLRQNTMQCLLPTFNTNLSKQNNKMPTYVLRRIKRIPAYHTKKVAFSQSRYRNKSTTKYSLYSLQMISLPDDASGKGCEISPLKTSKSRGNDLYFLFVLKYSWMIDNLHKRLFIPI